MKSLILSKRIILSGSVSLFVIAKHTTRIPILINATGIIIDVTVLKDLKVVLNFFKKTAYI